MAASVANSLGGNIDQTNISRTSAARRSQEERLQISSSVKENFPKPQRGICQFDGKILKVKGNQQSNRIAVYFTGVEEKPIRKFLGAPDVMVLVLQRQRW